MFRHKYLKYKKKYLDLKNSNLKGGGEQPIENSSTPIEKNVLIDNIKNGEYNKFQSNINKFLNLNNLEGILSLFIDILSLFIDYDDLNFKNKIIYLKIIIEIIINDERPDIKKSPRIKELLQTLADKIKNLQNSMTKETYTKEYWPLYNDINNYFNDTYQHYLKDDNTNISSSSSVNKHPNNRGPNNRGHIFRGRRSKEQKERIEEIVRGKRKHSKEEISSITTDEQLQIKQWLKKKEEQKLNEDQEQTQIEFKSTMVEK